MEIVEETDKQAFMWIGDAREELGDGMKKMLEMSVTPYIGSNIDISL